MPYIGKKPADIIATAVDTTTGTFSGDLTVDTSTLYVDSANNRVGIGTTSPASAAGSDTTLEISGSTGPSLTINDTGQAEKYSLLANSNDLKIYYGATPMVSFQNDGFVGIGTASPASAIHAVGSITVATIESTAANGDIQIKGSGTTGYTALRANAENLVFLTNTAERMRIDSSGNVGIGTASPATSLEISTTSPVIRSTHSTSGDYLQLFHNGSGAYIDFSADPLIIRGASNAERARIDSSGNLLVGGTNSIPGAGNTAVGASIYNDGRIFLSKSANTVASFNRNTSDGGIVEFRKDGTTVGSIGAEAGDLYIGTDDTGIEFVNGVNAIVPVNATSGADRDNAIDLGIGSIRFKDLYLSGGAYIKGSDPKITLEHSNENGTALIYTTAQSAIVLDADPANTDNGTPIIFKVDGSEHMRIDDGGNLLVGKTSTDFNTAGIALRSADVLQVTRSADTALELNRTSNDGKLAEFYKDGSSVGIIGTQGDRLTIGNDAVGLRFNGSNGNITPWNISTNALNDGGVDLGSAGARFKDLYLSGGVYLGGTGSANHLNDYEEGFVNLGIYPSASGTITIGTNADRCEYTKVGRKVTITGLLGVASVSSPVGQYISIQNLPFTVANLTDYAGTSAGSVMFKDNSDTSSNRVTSIGTYAPEGQTILRAYINPSTIVAGDDFYISLTYFTT